LISFDGVSITYDVLGNPTSYRGHSLSWGMVRQLEAYDQNTFEYNASGIRVRKNGTEYELDGTTIVKESRTGTVIRYRYGVEGLIGFTYNGTDYYYTKNLLGDITGIYGADGIKYAAYEYDAWGNHTVTLDVNGIGTINPFRYRGYYFDVETGLYYLQTRYYDPATGRFLNADRYVSKGLDIKNTNLFSYCGNNPVLRIDASGQFWEEIWDFALEAIKQIGQALGIVAPAYAGAAITTMIDGPFPIADCVAGVAVVVVTTGAIAYGTYQAVKYISIPRVTTKEKTIEITQAPPEDIVVYRWPKKGTMIVTFTPSKRDVDNPNSGLSFSTEYKVGSAATTIGRLNMTGVVLAIIDGPSHVSVYPIGGTLEDWYEAGPDSEWSKAVKAACCY
jgi:RHS repeat-associated protein